MTEYLQMLFARLTSKLICLAITQRFMKHGLLLDSIIYHLL